MTLMDPEKLIGIVKEYPVVWHKNSEDFIEQIAWHKIGQLMNHPEKNCKDTFIDLREKYFIEKKQQQMFGEKYTPWAHLERLSFLDSHNSPQKQEVFEPTLQNDQITEDVKLLKLIDQGDNFDKALIGMVKEAKLIWNSKGNGNLDLKVQLWKHISETLNKRVNICKRRWKFLKEKYVAENFKYQNGKDKWKFLDDLSFLDSVLQHRLKKNNVLNDQQLQNSASISVSSAERYFDDDSSFNDTSNTTITKNEDCLDLTINEDSNDSGRMSVGRKRSASDNSESFSSEKRERIDEDSKTSEQIFGDLVASMLTKKSQQEKNIAMIDIMKILTK